MGQTVQKMKGKRSSAKNTAEINARGDTHFNGEYGNQLLLGMYEKYKTQQFTDITLRVENHTIRAHKVVLCAFSKHLDAMLTDPKSESSKNEITLEEVSVDTAQLLIEFAYTGHIKINRDNVDDVLQTANRWSVVDSFQTGCTKYFIEHLQVSNCLGMLCIAKSFGLKELYEAGMKLAEKHFVKVMEAEGLQSLDTETVKDLVRIDKVCMINDGLLCTAKEMEEQILQVIVKFVEGQDKGKREEICRKLLPHVRWIVLLGEVHSDDSDATRTTLKETILKSQSTGLSVAEEILKACPPEAIWKEVRLPGAEQEWSSEVYADAQEMCNYLGQEIKYSSDPSVKAAHISGMKMWIRHWDGHRVLGGLQVFFSNGKAMAQIGSVEKYVDVYEFHLENEEEVITRVDLQSGWCIDSMKFRTNMGRTFGPYGGADGGARQIYPPGYLQALTWVNFICSEDQDLPIITCMQYGFRYFDPPSEKDPKLENATL